MLSTQIVSEIKNQALEQERRTLDIILQESDRAQAYGRHILHWRQCTVAEGVTQLAGSMFWDLVSCAAKIHFDTGTNPVNNLVPSFIEDAGDALVVRPDKIDAFKEMMKARGVVFKNVACSTRVMYNCRYKFSNQVCQGFVIEKRVLAADSKRRSQQILASLQDALLPTVH